MLIVFPNSTIHSEFPDIPMFSTPENGVKPLAFTILFITGILIRILLRNILIGLCNLYFILFSTCFLKSIVVLLQRKSKTEIGYVLFVSQYIYFLFLLVGSRCLSPFSLSLAVQYLLRSVCPVLLSYRTLPSHEHQSYFIVQLNICLLCKSNIW